MNAPVVDARNVSKVFGSGDGEVEALVAELGLAKSELKQARADVEALEKQLAELLRLGACLLRLLLDLVTQLPFQRLQGQDPDGVPAPDAPHLLDVPNYIDYLIVNYWGGNWDWPWNNYWLARKRTPDSTGFKFYCWDTEDIMLSSRSPLPCPAGEPPPRQAPRR